MSEWISINNKLPPYHTAVFVISDGKVYVAEEMLTWEDGHATIYIYELKKWRRFSHWMPIPELPKEV